MTAIVQIGTLTLSAPTRVRVSEETASRDHDVTVPAGTYPLMVAVGWSDGELRIRGSHAWASVEGARDDDGRREVASVYRATYWTGGATDITPEIVLGRHVTVREWSPRPGETMSRVELAAGARFTAPTPPHSGATVRGEWI